MEQGSPDTRRNNIKHRASSALPCFAAGCLHTALPHEAFFMVWCICVQAISTTQLRRNMVQRMASLEKEPASEGVGNAALISIPSEPEAFAGERT